MAGSERDQASGKPHVVIVGGGIAGLSAAFYLRNEPVRVTLLEGSSRIGGKLSVSEVAGVAVDEGAESLYANRRKTTGLIKEAGLGDRIMSAGVTASAIWTRDEIRQQPDRQFMGVPCDLDDLARSGVLSAMPASTGRGRISHCPRSTGTATSRSRRTSGGGSARRSSTASSTRSSPVCSPAVPRTCRSRPR